MVVRSVARLGAWSNVTRGWGSAGGLDARRNTVGGLRQGLRGAFGEVGRVVGGGAGGYDTAG